MSEAEALLPPTDFVRVHRSYIVNLDKIKDIKYYNLVIAGKTIPISKSLKSEVLKRLNLA